MNLLEFDIKDRFFEISRAFLMISKYFATINC